MSISTFSFILAEQSKSGGSLVSLMVLVLPMAALVYIATVPQRKQRQKQADMLRKVEVGDEVLTNGGIVGVITFVEDELFHVEVDDDVVVRVSKSAISKNLTNVPDEPPAKSRKGLLEGALGGGASKSADEPSGSKDSVGAANSKVAKGVGSKKNR